MIIIRRRCENLVYGVMFSKFKIQAIRVLILLYTLYNCDGQSFNNPLNKVIDDFKHTVSIDVKNDKTSVIHNIKGKYETINESVRQNGAIVVNRTVTVAKESLDKVPVKSIANILKDSKCIIPKNADNILRAALIQQCISPSHGFGNETRCFDEIGCFPMENPWISNSRPFPQPMTPKEIDVKLYAYTRKQNKQHNVKLWPNISLDGSDFNSEREYTVFIVHGFNSDGENQWMTDLKDGYLKHRDANVFLVDWGKGSKLFNYLQVASNTRVVGAELIRFGRYLIDNYQLNPQKIHMMGHSLGAHVCSYFGKSIRGLSRITAFDPAQPGFEGCPKEVRLDKSDANFVDVIHTSCRPTVPLLGFGLISAVGHVDIYMNGGFIQPGCTLPPINEVQLTSISDLAAVPADVLGSWVACSHGRSYLYFTESLQNDCTFWAQKTTVHSAITNIVSLGQLQPILIKIDKCKFDECIPLGLDIEQYPGRGVFGAGTAFFKPYCKSNIDTDRLMRDELRSTKQTF